MLLNIITSFNWFASPPPPPFRTPLLTIKTNTYHFCKLSTVKNPSAWSKYCRRKELGETFDGEIPEDKREEAYATQSCSQSFEGLRVLVYNGCFSKTFGNIGDSFAILEPVIGIPTILLQ